MGKFVTKKKRKQKFKSTLKPKTGGDAITAAAVERLLEAKPPEGASRQVRRSLERSQAKIRDAQARKAGK